jgi:hypothetical protein
VGIESIKLFYNFALRSISLSEEKIRHQNSQCHSLQISISEAPAFAERGERVRRRGGCILAMTKQIMTRGPDLIESSGWRWNCVCARERALWCGWREEREINGKCAPVAGGEGCVERPREENPL